jgi:hypothetical protein
LEEKGCGTITVLYTHSPGAPRKTRENPQSIWLGGRVAIMLIEAAYVTWKGIGKEQMALI